MIVMRCASWAALGRVASQHAAAIRIALTLKRIAMVASMVSLLSSITVAFYFAF
jgi:hypothetical protein